VSADQFDRRGFIKTAGGVAAGAAVSASLAGRPDTAAAASPAASPAAAVPKEAAASHNPFITDIYTADPDAFVFGGRLYVDTDRDRAPLGATDFVMTDWHVYSTTDTVTWTYHGVRMSLADFPWANRNAWAPQMVHRDGGFYWYVPVQQASTGAMTIAVAVGDSPLGPFTDALGGPLIDRNVPNHSAFDIDPTVLVDDDGQAYIYWGSFSSPRAAKLKDNMIELAELGDDAPGGGDQATGPRATGRLGNAVTLGGVADYIALPAGVVSGLSDFTIAAWINPAAIPTWSRIFDFGTGTGTYMFLTVNAGGGPRFAISTGGAGGEQRLSRTGQLPTGTWTHVAVTLAGTTGTLYVNGAPTATNTAMTLRPADLGTTTDNWIGRSQFSDPFLAATVDDVHIYDHALDAGEVATLAGGRPGAGNVAAYLFDEDGGATALDSSGNGRDATIISPVVNVLTPQGLTGYWEAPFLFKRNGIYYLAYARGNPLTGGNPASIDYATAERPLGPWTYRGRILDTVTNTTTNHSAIVEYNGQWYIVYHNGMLAGGGEFRRSLCIDKLFFDDDGTIREVVQTLSPAARRPVARYRFDEAGGQTAADSSAEFGDWPGTLAGGVTRVPGLGGGRALRLGGAGGHVGLPAGMVWNMYDFSLAGWVKLAGGPGGPGGPGGGTAAGAPHLVDFGTGTTAYLYLTSGSAAAQVPVRFAITTGGATREQRVSGTAALPAGRWTHVAVTKSALVATLYVNGVQVGQNSNLGLYPARLGNTANNWIGRSQNPADPFLAADIDDFRIYQRGLDAVELAQMVVPGLIHGLADFIAEQPIGGGIKRSLTAKPGTALALLSAGHAAEAIGVINDDFVGEIEDLDGSGRLPAALATELVRWVALITANIAQHNLALHSTT
jgi:hypothetical protein